MPQKYSKTLNYFQMDLNAKLAACEKPVVSFTKISIKEITQPAKILSAKRVPTRFNRPAILLEVVLEDGSERVTFLPARFEKKLTDENLQYFTESKKFSVLCTTPAERSPHVKIFEH